MLKKVMFAESSFLSGICLQSYIKCKNVDYGSQREETFFDIQLNIKGKKSGEYADTTSVSVSHPKLTSVIDIHLFWRLHSFFMLLSMWFLDILCLQTKKLKWL